MIYMLVYYKYHMHPMFGYKAPAVGPYQAEKEDLERLLNSPKFLAHLDWLAVKTEDGHKYYLQHEIILKESNTGLEYVAKDKLVWTKVEGQQLLFEEDLLLSKAQAQFKEYWGDDWRG